MSDKTEKHIIQMRVQEILSLLVQGAALADIWQYVDEKTQWGVSKRTVRRYKKRAEKLIEKASEFKASRELGLAIKRLNDLYARSLAIQDYKGCLAVQKELNELLGIKKMEKGLDGVTAIGTINIHPPKPKK